MEVRQKNDDPFHTALCSFTSLSMLISLNAGIFLNLTVQIT